MLDWYSAGTDADGDMRVISAAMPWMRRTSEGAAGKLAAA
jgi:hypothetical protein